MADLRIHEQETGVEVLLDDVAVATYVIRPDVPATETPKPYLHPLRTAGGAVVTGFRPDDHPWHHGLQLAMPRVGGHNLWGGGTYTAEQGYVVLEDHGRIVHDAWTSLGDATVVERLRWLGHADELLLTERRALRFAAAATGGWTVAITSSLANATGQPLALETPAQRGRPDGGYGGLFWRAAAGMRITSIEGEDGPVSGPGPRSPWLCVRARSAAGADVTIGCGNGQTGGEDALRWIIRADDFPAIGWAVAYDEGVLLDPSGQLQLSHSLYVADGSPSADDVQAVLRGAV